MHSLQQVAAFRLRVVKHARKSGNISETARLYRISRQSIYRWMERYDGTRQSLLDRSRRPHHHPHEHTEEEIKQILRSKSHNKTLGLVCFWIHLKRNIGYSRSVSALYRLLRRKGILAPPRKRPRRKSKPYEPILVPGERFQVDVKYVPRSCLVGALSDRQLYQYTAALGGDI